MWLKMVPLPQQKLPLDDRLDALGVMYWYTNLMYQSLCKNDWPSFNIISIPPGLYKSAFPAVAPSADEMLLSNTNNFSTQFWLFTLKNRKGHLSCGYESHPKHGASSASSHPKVWFGGTAKKPRFYRSLLAIGKGWSFHSCHLLSTLLRCALALGGWGGNFWSLKTRGYFLGWYF